MKYRFLTLLLFLGGSLNSFAQLNRTEKLDSLFTYLEDKGQINGGILIVEKGEVLLNRTAGYANIETKQKITSSTPVNLASISKQFVAYSIMILKDRGKLSFDDPITKYLPKLPYSNITIRHLLNHTSGLRDYMFPCAMAYGIKDTVSNQMLLDLYAKKKYKLKYTPGSKHDYSNTGYILLSCIVTAITQQELGDFLHVNIFSPLGMNDAYVFNKFNQDTYDSLCWSYNMRYKKKEFSYVDGVNGDGNVCLSLNDFIAWGTELNTHSLVSDSSWKQAMTSYVSPSGDIANYGFGLALNDDTFGHSGGWLSFNTLIIKTRNENSFFVYLFNRTPGELSPIARDFFQVIDGSDDEPFNVSKKKEKHWIKLHESLAEE